MVLEDWYIQGRQILTHFAAFMILLYLMSKYLWNPFLRIVDERSAKIREEFDKAEELQHKFESLRADYDDRLKKIEAEANARMNEAIAKGQATRDEIVERANKDAAEIRARVEREIHTKLDNAAIEMKEQLVGMTLMATEKILGERLDDQRQRAMIGEFLDTVSAKTTNGRS